jgi:nucleoside-diphosphate-sugar epimerase
LNVTDRYEAVADTDVVIITVGTPLLESFETSREYGDTYEEIRRRVPRVGKAARLLGWSSAVPLEEGILRTVAWAWDNEWWLADAAEQKVVSDEAAAQ